MKQKVFKIVTVKKLHANKTSFPSNLKPLFDTWLTFHQSFFFRWNMFCFLGVDLPQQNVVNGGSNVKHGKPNWKNRSLTSSCELQWHKFNYFYWILSFFLVDFGFFLSSFLRSNLSGSYFGNERWHRNEFVLKSKQTFFL